MTTQILKRLRFAYNPQPDESVCGAFVAACHDQRLRAVASGLEGAGLKLPRPAHLQFADGQTLRAAATAMRADPDALLAMAFAPGKQRDVIVLGGVAVPRAVIELDRRRIAPNSLSDQPHHRTAWLNLLLPYCPVSLEVVVDRCPVCGPLGWRRTRGIARCETCGQTVPPSSEPPLSPALSTQYHFAAHLLSPDEEVGASALSVTSDTLSPFSRTTIAAIALRTGVVARHRPAGWTIDVLTKQPASVVAATMCLGVEMLRDWPDSIRAFAAQRMDDMGDDVAAYETLRADLKWIGGRSTEGHAIIAAAFPKIDGRTADTFAGATRYYSASETNTILWTASSELKLLRDAEALDYEKLPSNLRVRARYRADDVDALRTILDDVVTPGSAAVELDLPAYALEGLADHGPLIIHDEPGVVALRGPQVAASSIKAVADELLRKATRSTLPTGYVPLAAALAAYPGEKPYGPAFRALMTEQLPFYLDDDTVSVRRIWVDPHFVSLLGAAPREPGRLSIEYLSIRDSCEILTTGYAEGIAAIKAKGIEIVRHGRGHGVLRTALTDLVTEIAFIGEAAAYKRRNGMELHHALLRNAVARRHGAWLRDDLVQLGMVMPFE